MCSLLSIVMFVFAVILLGATWTTAMPPTRHHLVNPSEVRHVEAIQDLEELKVANLKEYIGDFDDISPENSLKALQFLAR